MAFATNNESHPNPYADDPLEAWPSVTGLVGVEGDTIYCRQGFDFRRYCTITGQPSQDLTHHACRYPVLPAWWSRLREPMMIGHALFVILLAVFAGLEIALWAFITRPIVMMVCWLFLPKLKGQIGYSASTFTAGNPRRWASARYIKIVIGLIPIMFIAFHVQSLLVSLLMTGNLPPSYGTEFHIFLFCVILVGSVAGEFVLPVIRVTQTDREIFALHGFANSYIDALRCELS